MKATLLVVAIILFTACGKKNEVPALQQEATVLAKYYAPKLASHEQRLNQIMDRGQKIPGNLPGIDNVTKRVQEARDKILALKGIVSPGPDGKSAVEKMAEQSAKEKKVADLRKLIHDTQHTLAEGVTVINDNLTTVENWISQYDRQALAMPPQPAQPATPEAAQPAAPPQ